MSFLPVREPSTASRKLASTEVQSCWLQLCDSSETFAFVAAWLAPSEFLPAWPAAAVVAKHADVAAVGLPVAVDASLCAVVAAEVAEAPVQAAAVEDSQQLTEEGHLREKPSIAVVAAAVDVAGD